MMFVPAHGYRVIAHDRRGFETTGKRSVELLEHGRLISYPGFPHGVPTTQAEVINRDLLTFIQS